MPGFTLSNNARKCRTDLLSRTASDFHKCADFLYLRVAEFGTFSVIAGLILAPFTEQSSNTIEPEAVQLVDGPQYGQALIPTFLG